MNPARLPSEHADPKGGFTLVEILVVLAIITVLAAIVFPQVRGALSSARTAKSTNQLRQIYTTIAGYVADNNGDYPYSYGTQGGIPPGKTDRVLWYNVVKVRLYPHPNDPTRSALDGADGWGGVNDTDLSGTILRSPNAEKTWRKGVATYGYNDLFAYNPNRSQKLNLLFDNTKTAMLADNMNASGSGTQSLNSAWAFLNARNGATRDLATNGRAIVVFLDGHSELLTADQCARLNTSGNDVFWKGKP